MTKRTYPRLEILAALDELAASVSKNRFVSTRPTSTSESMEDFILLRLPQPMHDRGDTYQSTTGQIAVFVRDLQGGLENTFRLEEMQSQVMDLFPIVNERFHGKNPILLNGGTDLAGFHSLIIQFHITILKS